MEDKSKWSKSKKKRMRKLLSKSEEQPLKSEPPAKKQKPSSLQQKFQAQLTGSRFRILNEELYTTPSNESFDRFSNNPDLFDQYHEGFRHQVESWPTNPVDVIVRGIRGAAKEERKTVVADFGCGDAQLAKELLKYKVKGQCPFVVHSFDLVAKDELVTACDMSKVPLADESVDIGVFCLALMGTNLADFIREAHRVLKQKGTLKIAEVRSRFEGKGNDLKEFLEILEKLGFKCAKTDRSNTMFVLLELRKNGKNPDPKLEYTAKPCIYKRR